MHATMTDAEGKVLTIPEPGLYRHFKGGEYELLQIAKHSETEELLAVYRQGDQVWVRPVEMFVEPVAHGHGHIPRFVRVRRRRPGIRRPARWASHVVRRMLTRRNRGRGRRTREASPASS